MKTLIKQFNLSVVLLCCLLTLIANANAAPVKTKTAIFAGGCFWSMQHDFEKLNGIVLTTVGYTGGNIPNPTYQQVSSGNTGHYEAIKIEYNPDIISYQEILDFYWHDTDPTNASGQFCDIGSEYQPVIFYGNDEQEKIARYSKTTLQKSRKFNVVATKIMPEKTFYPAEEYHQHYSNKNPAAYDAYRSGCRRDATLRAVWQK